MNEEPQNRSQWADNYFRDESLNQLLPIRRGLVGHVRIVAVLMIVQGVLELGFALMMLAMGIMFLAVPQPDVPNIQSLAILFFCLSVPALIAGVLHVWAGPLNWRFHGRRLGIVALSAGLISMFTFYCALSGIPLAVYGLIVYLNDSVENAFALGQQGRSAAEIDKAFPPRDR